jgi:MarR family transcriptional regulator, organic hydroperoxide resistance regulator
MSAAAETGTGTPAAFPALSHTDLTWLLHRAGQHMRAALDEVARGGGLNGARDWIVLSALSDGPRQTQLSLAHSLGLDKTTMTALLDRLQADGLITRCLDSNDRRARIPELTGRGREVQCQVTGAWERKEAELLGAFTPGEQRLLRELLTRLASGEAADCLKATGSCM